MYYSNSYSEYTYLMRLFLALQKHIQVDIYGQCGHFKCSRADENSCWQQVEKDYFFYLAFENSICKDYVTEKFFNAMNHSVVPIVLGGANYTQMAPVHSHINAYQDYKNDAGQLAKYLNDLMTNKAEYIKYFWWKSFYSGTIFLSTLILCLNSPFFLLSWTNGS